MYQAPLDDMLTNDNCSISGSVENIFDTNAPESTNSSVSGLGCPSIPRDRLAFCRAVYFAARKIGFTHYLKVSGICPLCYWGMKLLCNPKNFVRAQEAAHNKLEHTQNGNIDREDLISFYAKDWIGMDLSKTKTIPPWTNPALEIYPAKNIRRGNGTAFPMPELAGTIYARAP